MQGGGLLDFLFPHVCIGCGKFIHAGNYVCKIWCTQCEAKRSAAPSRRTTINNGVEIISAHSFDDAHIRNAIHALKYEYQRGAGKLLGAWVYEAAVEIFSSPMTLIPIPPTNARFALRGFNHAADIARGIAALAGAHVCVDETILSRVSGHGAQAHRTREERIHAMKDVFSAKITAIDTRFCVVDDVITTGSTMQAAIAALQRAGATKITGITVAAA